MPAIDDSSLFRPLFSSVCTQCKHFNPASPLSSKFKGGACRAFPNGIPEEIWLGKNDHRSPYPGDNGITFEQRVAP